MFGSFAWQFFAADPAMIYVTRNSDIDLLLTPAHGAQLAAWIALLQNFESRWPAPRLDGEIALPGGDFVSWREFAARPKKFWSRAPTTSACARSTTSTLFFREGRMKRQTHFAPDLRGAAGDIGRLAVRALLIELMLHPKPGLVSPVDNGAHDDMNLDDFRALLFWRCAPISRRSRRLARARRLSATCRIWGSRPSGGCWRRRAGSTPIAARSSASAFSPRRRAGGGRAVSTFKAKDLTETVLHLWGEGVAEVGRTAPDCHGARADPALRRARRAGGTARGPADPARNCRSGAARNA